ncbi:formyltetrahydrofolate deformylase [Acanthopleuribacter pedis]|uniref:Formyltetrahydrofolate deformylase n=1 Tax=Acanthopleuribacter pedis TaxID=442870 RepID=A0A8J7QPQ0_9BACT|nr:formyltetrahydrofolate deformylase [Acanthopleuribacter pedis]MBO1322388.1 formyltetrahydrofolate deformylase [Acanthopleuribacter pedis]
MRRIILVEAPDAVGLVYKTTGVFFDLALNIVSTDEFVEPKEKRFFMRAEVVGEADNQTLTDLLKQRLPEEAVVRVETKRPKNIVIMATKESHCLGDLLIRHYAGELNANILGVIANHETLRPLVEKFEIPFTCVPHEGLSRLDHEALVRKEIDPYEPEYIVLAKYMRVLSPEFVAAYPRRLVNIHHSFLPAFIGANPYRQAWQRGVKVIGATSHLVTDDLDAGPIIAQQVLPVTHSHSARDMAMAGRDVEKITLATALKLVFEDRVMVHKNRTIIFE